MRPGAAAWTAALVERVYRPLRAAWPRPSWEPREQALRRLGAALDGFDGVAVTHGLAIALYTGLTFDGWRSMPFPAVIER